MERPILLLKNELTKPISQALERIGKIRERKAENVDSIILEGLFALAVSSFENSLNDTLRVLFTSIPEKLDIKAENISKNELIDGNPLKQAIESKVSAVSYKSLQEIIGYFTTTTDLNGNLVTEDELNALLEIKATRNLLIHNNLIENNFYTHTSGPRRRIAIGNERKLTIDQDYLYQSLIVLRSVLQKFLNGLENKYAHYTKIRAAKELFNYIFKTPVMVFDNEFAVDEERDVISNRKDSSRMGALSSSERFYFDIWIAHTHGNKFEFNSGQFFFISDKEKFSFFIKNIDLLMT